MSTISSSSVFTIIFASCLANLLWSTVVWGQSVTDSVSIGKEKQYSSESELPEFRQHSTRAADLILTCSDLLKISQLNYKSYCQSQTEHLVQTEPETKSEEQESQILEPTKERCVMALMEKDPGIVFDEKV